MSEKLIYGIQQIGVGVKNAYEAFEWYATRLGADASIFEDNNTATYMAPYMGGQPRKKRAILAMNLQGGGGYEIWQYLEREPSAPKHSLQLGDTGIQICTIKSRDIDGAYKRLKAAGENVLTEVVVGVDKKRCFYMTDPYGNWLRIKEWDSWYTNYNHDLGGVCGAVIGVSDIDAARKLYSNVLGYDEVCADETGEFNELAALPGGNHRFRRVVLRHSAHRVGGFSKLLGDTELELIQVLDRAPHKIFEDRYWGDLGFIHLCFDIRNMSALIDECAAAGFPFSIKSSESFDMGEANGRWGYLEDGDGTLIEFVETRKVPLIKKIGLNIDLRNRDPKKPLPDWMIKAMRFKRVKRFKKD
ncbi:MAG: VOC family protein [Flavobacteriales bacterium]